MATLAKGTKLYIVTAANIAAAKTVTAVTNATEAVVTVAAHGYSAGDIVMMESGWGGLNGRVARVKSPTTNDFVLEGINTTNTDLYPAGTGTGQVRKITAFQQITKVTDISSSGGEPKNTEYDYLEEDTTYSITEGFSPVNWTIELDADSISTAGYAALQALTEVRTDTVFLQVTKNGAKNYTPCTVALLETVKTQRGKINVVTCSLNGKNRPTRYAS